MSPANPDKTNLLFPNQKFIKQIRNPSKQRIQHFSPRFVARYLTWIPSTPCRHVFTLLRDYSVWQTQTVFLIIKHLSYVDNGKLMKCWHFRSYVDECASSQRFYNLNLKGYERRLGFYKNFKFLIFLLSLWKTLKDKKYPAHRSFGYA